MTQSIRILPQKGFDYINTGNPTASVNPPCALVTWLNATSGEIFLCLDNTVDSNDWVSVSSLYSNHLVKAKAYISAAANSPNNAWGKVPLDTILFDTGPIWDDVGKRFIPTKAGYYQCALRARTNTTGLIATSLRKNGSNDHGAGSDSSGNATGGQTLVHCNGTTDYLELGAFTSTARAYTTGSFDTHMAVIGPF